MEDQRVIQALSSHAQEKACANRSGAFHMIRRFEHLDATHYCDTSETGSKLAIIPADEIRGGLTRRSRLSQRYVRSRRRWKIASASPEYVIGSVHAITHQGQILIASGSGSQLAGYAFGASHIIWVVGAQKIVRNVDEGLRRIWEYSYPLENERMQTLYGTGSFPAKILLVEGEMPGRISVLLVKEALGF